MIEVIDFLTQIKKIVTECNMLMMGSPFVGKP